MSRREPSGPDLDGVVADANVGLEYVVIGGFSVIANGFLRATKDSDLLVPDEPETDAVILRRPQDRRDLEALEAFHGELPIDPIPGLDD